MSRNAAEQVHHPMTWQQILSGLSLSIGLWLATGLIIEGKVYAQSPALVQQGYTLLDRGWVNDAITTFRQALQRYPQSQEAQLGLAIAYQRAGQDANAWAAYQQVLRQEPNNRQALAAIGLLGGYRPEWQAEGITALTHLLELVPNDLKAKAQRALLYGYQGNFTAALADYAVVLANNPTPDMILGAAQIYTYSGDFVNGRSLFERYLATGKPIPNSSITAYALALQNTGDAQQAVNLLETRLRALTTLDATAIQIRSSLALAYQANQQTEQALAVLEPLQGDESAALPLARSLSAIGRDSRNADLFEGAVAIYRQVLARTPNPSIGLLTEIADVFSESPATQVEALQLYQKLAAELPNQPSLQVKRLAIEYQLGQISKTELRQGLEQVLNPLPSDAAERRSLAIALLRIDTPDPALLSVYQNLATEAANQPFFNYRIAQIYLQQGQFDQARQALNAYANSDDGTDDPASDLLLAEIERQEGNLERSAQRYEALIARNLGDEIGRDALRGLAGIRLAQGRRQDALQLYNELVANYPYAAASRLGQAGIAYQLNQISQAEAEAALADWVKQYPNAEPPGELFILVSALPASESRAELYDKLLAIDPYNIGINSRWVELWATRDPDKASDRVNDLIAHDPQNVNVYFIQGELAQQIGNLALASQAYETILAAQPNNVDALSALGGVRFQEKRYGQATRIYQQVLAQRPDDLTIRRILADLSAVQGNRLSAEQQFYEIQQRQLEAGAPDPAIANRLEQIRVDILKQRGLQPYWERY